MHRPQNEPSPPPSPKGGAQGESVVVRQPPDHPVGANRHFRGQERAGQTPSLDHRQGAWWRATDQTAQILHPLRPVADKKLLGSGLITHRRGSLLPILRKISPSLSHGNLALLH